MIKIINEGEINKLLTKASKQDIRDFTMVYLALSTGLRCSELIGLYVEDIQPFGEISRILTVPTRIGKNGKKREIPINHETQSLLAKFFRIKGTRGEFMNSDSLVFVSKYSKKPLSTRDFQRIVKDLSIRSISRPISPHVLRHTFATRLLRHTNLRVVQETLGHARVQTTQIYTHININDVLEACLLYTSPSPRDRTRSRMPSSA